jgi:hypothetical protein
MTTYGIGHTDVLNSCWYFVDAINNHPSMQIMYSDDHAKQYAIAESFLKVSSANIGCCAGVIDGMLIWIHKPSLRDCTKSVCSSGKVFCGQKKKFGLNCHAVCDVHGRILDLSIEYLDQPQIALHFKECLCFRNGRWYLSSEIVLIWRQCLFELTKCRCFRRL